MCRSGTLPDMPNPLRAYLTLKGMTGTAFAELVDLSPGFLSRLMSGEREADATILAKIEAATNGEVTPDLWVKWWRREKRREEA